MKDPYLSMIKARSALNQLYQELQENTAVFHNRFVSMVDAFEHYGGTIGGEDGLIKSLEETNDPGHPRKDPQYSVFEADTSFKALVSSFP